MTRYIHHYWSLIYHGLTLSNHQEPQWSISTEDRLPSVPASVVTGSTHGHINLSQATSMAGTVTSTSILTMTWTPSSVGQLLTTSSPSLVPTAMTSSPKDSPSPQVESADVYDLIYPKGWGAVLSLLAQNPMVQSVI